MYLKRLKSMPGPPASFVAFVVSLVAAAGITTAVASTDVPEVPEEKDGMYPATERVVVATGMLDGIGRYRVLYSRDYKGGMCTGLELVDLVPPGARGPDISEGCGGPEYMNIGVETAVEDNWTIVHGKVPADTKRLQVRTASGESLQVTPSEDDKGVAGEWVIRKLDGRHYLEDLEFEAIDAGGSSLATQSEGEVRRTE